MAHEIRKKVSVPREAIGAFQTSRRLQWVLILGPVILILGLLGWLFLNQKEKQAALLPQPTEIHFAAVEDLKFVDTKTGKPLIWYAKTVEGYVLYNSEGFHSNGTALLAAKGVEIQKIKAWAQQQIISRQTAAVEALFSFSRIPPNSSAVVVAIQGDALPAQFQEMLTSQIITALSDKFSGRVFVPDAVTPQFYSQGYFDRAFSRDIAFLNDVSFFRKAKALILIRPSLTIKDTTSVAGMKSAQLQLEFKTFVSNGLSPKVATFQAAGAGFSEDAGLRNAIEALFLANDESIKKLFSGDL